jgi:hypothetical protein
MNREELVAVRDVIDALLRCPDHVRELLTQWIAPVVARPKERTVPLIFSKPNGRDPHPPPIAPMGKASETDGVSSRRSPAPYAGKARRGKPPPSAKAAEQRLLAALRERPDQTAGALARSVGGAHTTIGRQLKSMAERGAIEKGAEGLWRLAGEEARPTSPSPAAS